MAPASGPVVDAAPKLEDPRAATSRVVAFMNGKGGVGKTTIVANVGGRLALSGLRVLLWDLDVSDNLGLDLGYAQRGKSDNGKGVFEAVMEDKPLAVLSTVRTNLDVIPGGAYLEALMKVTPPSDRPVPEILLERLADIADDYDLVLLDTPPGILELQDLALYLARHVVITTKTDSAGWAGVRRIAPRFNKARQVNPHLNYLGLTIFANATSAKAVLRSTRETLTGEFGAAIPLFHTVIRNSETAANNQRDRGQLAHELARDAASAQKERLQWLTKQRGKHRASSGGDGVLKPPKALARSADSLAGDYVALSREMLNRIRAQEEGA